MRKFVRIFNDRFNCLIIADFKCLGDDRGYLTYDLPNPIAYGQFLCVLTNITKQTSDGFIIGESAGDREYVILQECNSGVCNLCGEVAGLAFAKPATSPHSL